MRTDLQFCRPFSSTQATSNIYIYIYMALLLVALWKLLATSTMPLCSESLALGLSRIQIQSGGSLAGAV